MLETAVARSRVLPSGRTGRLSREALGAFCSAHGLKDYYPANKRSRHFAVLSGEARSRALKKTHFALCSR